MPVIPMKCPSCGGEVYSVARKVESYDDFLGASCKGCGRKVTDGDIKKQAIDIATDLLKNAIKGGGG